jgi:hypothetical protein
MCKRKNKQINKTNEKEKREGWLKISERRKYLYLKKQRDKTRNKTGKKAMKERK